MWDILPANGLDRSILTPVLVGLILSVATSEMLGWAFVAVVVPGYLTAVWIAAPTSAITIVAEAVITYVIAHVFGRWIPLYGGWVTFFGRERFFLFIAISVAVRLVVEGYVLPLLAPLIGPVAHSSELYSLGLVLVPLTANAFWNDGLIRGFARTTAVTVSTWAIVVGIVVPLINLDLTHFDLTYESVALGFLDAPKAYLVLLCGAALGAATNVRYGWDFGGILVPALLALAWYSPLKLTSTILESLWVVYLSKQTLKIPALSKIVIEGPRRVVMVFLVGYVWKFFLGHALAFAWPSFQVTDLYGFGYVMPSLLAAKIWVKQPARVLVPAITVSLLGFATGNLAGFFLSLLMFRGESGQQTRFEQDAAEWSVMTAATWGEHIDARTISDGQRAALQEFATSEPQPNVRFARSRRGYRWQVLEARGNRPAALRRTDRHRSGIVLWSASSSAIAPVLALDAAERVEAGLLVIVPPRSNVDEWVRVLTEDFDAPLLLAVVDDGFRFRKVGGVIEPSGEMLDLLATPVAARANYATQLALPPAAERTRPSDPLMSPIWRPHANESTNRILRDGEIRLLRRVLAQLRNGSADRTSSSILRQLGLSYWQSEEGFVLDDNNLGLRYVERATGTGFVAAPFAVEEVGIQESAAYLFACSNARAAILGGGRTPPVDNDDGLLAAAARRRTIGQVLAEDLLDLGEGVVILRALPRRLDRHHQRPIATDGFGHIERMPFALPAECDAIEPPEPFDWRQEHLGLEGADEPVLQYAKEYARGRAHLVWLPADLRDALRTGAQ